MNRRSLLRGWAAMGWSGLLAGCAGFPPASQRVQEPDFAALARRLDALRRRWRVPGMSAAVARGGAVAWSQGFGERDIASVHPATPDTIYHLASLTKPFAATVVLQLAQEGRMSLDAPVAEFGITLPSAGHIRVRHLLTNTSEDTPGETYRYNGARFKELDRVIERVTGHTFAVELRRRLLDPLGLAATGPNPEDAASCRAAGRDPSSLRARLAQGYESDGRTPVAYRPHFATSAGLVSTTGDMLRFATALHDGVLLEPEWRRSMFTPPVNTRGDTLPYGMGWFIQESRGTRLHWHYGWWTGCSSLIIIAPERRLAFVLLANADGLSRKFDLGERGNVRRSPFARAFLKTFGL